MPHVVVMMYPGRDDDIKRRLAESLREAIMKELHVEKNAVSVSMFDIDKDNFPKAMENIPKENMVIEWPDSPKK